MMPVRFTPETCAAATRMLARRDPALARLIKAHGPCTLGTRIRRNSFGALVRAIVYQQLSTGAATTIYNRTLATMNATRCPAPATWLCTPEERLRAAGLSNQKTRYVLDLCRHVTDGSLDTRRLHRMHDEDVITTLTQVKGIGRWTAEMFLMFNLLRPNVLPLDDLGLQKAMRVSYFRGRKVSVARMRKLGETWQPYRSVATWYLWRSLDPLPVEY